MRENRGLKSNPLISMSSMYGSNKILPNNINTQSNKLYPSFSVRLKNDETRVPKLTLKSGSTEIEKHLNKRVNYQS